MKKKTHARFHGARGGHYAEDGAGRLLEELHRARIVELRKGPEKGTWPLSSLREWEAIARVARARGDGISPSQREAIALEVVTTARRAGWRW